MSTVLPTSPGASRMWLAGARGMNHGSARSLELQSAVKILVRDMKIASEKEIEIKEGRGGCMYCRSLAQTEKSVPEDRERWCELTSPG